jgi:hypothetical protein
MATYIPWGRRLGYSATPALHRLAGASVEIISVEPAITRNRAGERLGDTSQIMRQWTVSLRINGWPETRFLLAKSEVDVMRIVHTATEGRIEKQQIPTVDIFKKEGSD